MGDGVLIGGLLVCRYQTDGILKASFGVGVFKLKPPGDGMRIFHISLETAED